jgi:hypothetical protein
MEPAYAKEQGTRVKREVLSLPGYKSWLYYFSAASLSSFVKIRQ